MLVGDELWQRLHELDDPRRVEFPRRFHHRKERRRFLLFADRLMEAFACTALLDDHPEDATYLGDVRIPAISTATGGDLKFVVSNFGGLVLVCVEGPGIYLDEEVAVMLAPEDDARAEAVIEATGYTRIPEEPLWGPYRGKNSHPFVSWFHRYFDYI